MSCKISNPGLALLCKKSDVPIHALAVLAKCWPRSIHLYASGEKHLPRIEKELAEVFKIKPDELRIYLMLSPQHKTQGRKNA